MITWQEKIVLVSNLKPYERNHRKISERAYSKLLSSLRDNGYHQRIIATNDLRVIGGHQRIRALKEIGTKAGFNIEGLEGAGMKNTFCETDEEKGECILILRKSGS